RILALRPGLGETDIQDRVRKLITCLSEGAIGLNTLLAIGCNQATGALGFFFALRSIRTWLADGKEDEVRLVAPIDAIDSFLRGSSTDVEGLGRERADLLAIRAFLKPDGV